MFHPDQGHLKFGFIFFLLIHLFMCLILTYSTRQRLCILQYHCRISSELCSYMYSRTNCSALTSIAANLRGMVWFFFLTSFVLSLVLP